MNILVGLESRQNVLTSVCNMPRGQIWGIYTCYSNPADHFFALRWHCVGLEVDLGVCEHHSVCPSPPHPAPKENHSASHSVSTDTKSAASGIV